jgi:hypothetical protein
MLLCLPANVSDVDLMRIGADNPGYRFEREEDGSLVVSPTSTKGGAKSGEAFVQLYLYAKRVGGKANDGEDLTDDCRCSCEVPEEDKYPRIFLERCQDVHVAVAGIGGACSV